MMDIVEQLAAVTGGDAIVGAQALRERATSYWDASPTRAKCLVRPASTEQLSALMRVCHDNDQSVVVQGGLTGIVEGAVSTASDVIVSLERMNRIESVDTMNGDSGAVQFRFLQRVPRYLDLLQIAFHTDDPQLATSGQLSGHSAFARADHQTNSVLDTRARQYLFGGSTG